MDSEYNSSVWQAYEWKALCLCDSLFAIVPWADVILIADEPAHFSVIGAEIVSSTQHRPNW